MTGLQQTTSPPVTVQQGPSWLVRVILSPPPWVGPAVTVAALAVFSVALYRLYQSGWRISFQRQLEMGRIAGTIVGVIIATLAMNNLTYQPYLVDVGVGFVVGYSAPTLLTLARVRRWVGDIIDDAYSRAALGWVLLAAASFFGPTLVDVHDVGFDLLTARLALAGLSAAMVVLNIAMSEAED